MGKHRTNLPFVFVLLLTVSGTFLVSGTVAVVQESITVDECKISCEKGSPKLLNGEWRCVDVIRHKQMIVSTIKPSSSKDGCNRFLKCQGIYCNHVKDCGHCCGRFLAPFCMYHKCACW